MIKKILNFKNINSFIIYFSIFNILFIFTIFSKDHNNNNFIQKKN